MAFFHQLKLLLWKNYTLKKRAPFILILELVVPLVLFLILVSIRNHRPPLKSSVDSWSPSALPSAGIIPLLQSFCRDRGRNINKDGYRTYPNASIIPVLKDIADISNTPLFGAIVNLKNLEEDFEKFDGNKEMSKNKREINDFAFTNIFTNTSSFKTFLSRNLSLPDYLVNDLLNATFNGSEISTILLEKNSHLFEEFLYAFKTGLPSQQKTKELQQSILMQALFDPTSFQSGPTWLRILASIGKIPGLTSSSTDWSHLKQFFIEQYLIVSEINTLACSKTVFNKLIILQNASKADKNELRGFLCKLNQSQTAMLADELQNNFNWTNLMKKLHVVGPSMESYSKKAVQIRKDLGDLNSIEDGISKLSNLAKDLHLNLTRLQGRKNDSRPHQTKQNFNDMWNIISPLICGSPVGANMERDGKPKKKKEFLDLLEGSGESTRALKIMLYMMTHNPKILYSPNGTDADKVICNSDHFLRILRMIKAMAIKWLKMSPKFRAALKRNETQNILKKMYKLTSTFPFIYDSHLNTSYNVFNKSPGELKRYLNKHNDTITKYINFVKPKMTRVIKSLIISKDGHNDILTQIKAVDYMATGWKVLLEPMQLNIYYGFPNETALLKFIENATLHGNNPILSAVLFDNIKEDGSLPKHIVYRIRMDGRLIHTTQEVRSPYWTARAWNGRSYYFYYGFVWMQDQLERAMIEVLTGKNVTSPGLYIQEVPYPCFLEDNFMFVIQYIMPLCVVVSFIYPVAILVQNIVYEKEQRLKEVMKMMGLSNAVHWTAWFITSSIIMMIIVILLTILLKVGAILQYSNPAIVLLFLTLAVIATTNFCFLMSIFFSNAKIAAACGGIIYFVTYMPYVFISVQEGGSSHQNIPFEYKTLASLFSTTAFGLGARYFASFEQNGAGVQWHNIASSLFENDSFNLVQVFTMLIVDTFLYGILVWYIEAIIPGTYGIPRPWYFPFQLSYWLGPNVNLNINLNCFEAYRRMRAQSRSTMHDPPNTSDLLAVDSEPTHLQLGVFMDNLVKIYKKGSSPAVDHLSLNLYEGQITSFLGHNGAGKTTTMSLLTGLFPPSSGTAYIYGYDIHSDMDKIRRSLGMCPQHNVLYNKLTVEEHLWFYARLKGMPGKQVKEETSRFLEDVGLPEKRKSQVHTLSGGMKRKLSVAMAFVGGSKTIILDEPTAGVDPYARRAIWELLAKYKDGRTILLSTHFMDEADILGDRIAIISHGKLRCCGSSLFLKKKFGDGYHLTIVKETDKTGSSKISTDSVTKFIQDYVPSASLVCETQYEMSYILPDKGKEHKGMLKKLFESLEENRKNLEFQSYGLQDTTLEEVFLKVTEATVAGEEDTANNELTTTVDLPIIPPTNEIPLLDTINQSVQSEVSNSSPKSETVKQLHLLKAKKPGHRRSFSTDYIDSQPKNKSTHRRTASGGVSGHRRTLSSDLTFALSTSNTNTPESIKKVSRHKRIPSGVAKLHSIGSESWQSQAGGTVTSSENMLRWQQFYGLLLKRMHHSRRNVKGLLTHILLPSIFVSIAMIVALSQPKAETNPPLVLSPTMFHPPPYYIPFKNNKKGTNDIGFRMENTLRLPSGIGSDCVLKYSNMSIDNKFPKELLRQNLNKYFDPYCEKQISKSKLLKPFKQEQQKPKSKVKKTNPKCYCEKSHWEYVCDEGVGGSPDSFLTVTEDTMLNITHQDFSQYLLYTNFKFKRRRYGALTFGDEQELVPIEVQQSPSIDVQKLFVRDTARVWFSNKGYHAMPAFVNAMDNAILRALITPEMGNPAAYGITAITHPLNFTRNALNLDSIKQGTDAIIAIFVIIAMSFVPASFVVFLVLERTTKSKHIQFVSGMNPVLYWLSNYVWDLLNYMVPAIACMIIFLMFNVPAYASKTNFPAVCALFVCYGWSITPMMYPASFLFKEASTAYVVLIIVNLFLGITCTVTTSILQLFPSDPQLSLALKFIKTGALIFPNYCLGRGLMDLAYNELMNMVHTQMGQFDQIRSPFEWHIVTRSLVCMFSEGIIFFIITLLIEYKVSVRRGTVQLMDNSVEGEEIDVAAERQRVLSGGAEDDLLRVENLTKIYNSKNLGKHLAVNRLCLGLSKGECFGLLGVNGAGKTTTFKMLTGDITVTAGDAFIGNNSVVRNILHVHKLIGYCPQFDALIDHLTAEEHLYLYARLKGIPELEIKDVCSWLIKKMALTRYAKKPSITYSGGNKRKLSAAIALIGNPSLIFMDEPTTGMDPGARRFLWNVILSIVQQGTRSIVLTSHSMEECEALCTRLAIMVNGQFQCLGSTQHIKNRFGDGYIVMIRVKGSLPNMGPVKNFMEESFETCILKECHHNVVQYQIPSAEDVSLHKIFAKMEDVCIELEIEDYSVSQTSLDNVFVNFAKDQRDVTMQNDPSFIYSKSATKLKFLKSKWRKMKSNIKTKKRHANFTQLVQLASHNVTGSIGGDEDEISLDGADSFAFPEETTRLTFDGV